MHITRKSANLIFSRAVLNYEAKNLRLRSTAGCISNSPSIDCQIISRKFLFTRSASTCPFAKILHTFSKPSDREMSETSENVREYKVPLPWGNLAIKEWGAEDGVPVLALHGWQDNAGTFDKLAPLLPASIRLICLDFAGHGLSSHYPPGMLYHYWDYILHVKLVIDHLKLEKVSILGHSLGGTVSLIFASIFPERVERVATIDIIKPISVPANAQPSKTANSIAVYQKMIEKLNGDAPAYTYEEARERLVKGNGGSIDNEAADVLMRRGVREVEKGRFAYSRDIRQVIPGISYYTNDQHQEYLGRLRCPLMIIKAKQGPYYEAKETCDEFVEMYRKNIKEFKYVEVEGTHHVHLVNPREVAPHVTEFLCEKSTA